MPPRDAPQGAAAGLPVDPPCPHCGSRRTRLESAFGSTLATAQYYCAQCRSMFEHVKRT